MNRTTRAQRGLRWRRLPWLVLALLAGLLAACGETPEARLALSPPAIVISGVADGTLVLANDGAPGSTLRFTVSSDADWLVVAPAEGRIGGGDSLALIKQLPV